jgi:hypothetical protein
VDFRQRWGQLRALVLSIIDHYWCPCPGAIGPYTKKGDLILHHLPVQRVSGRLPFLDTTGVAAHVFVALTG